MDVEQFGRRGGKQDGGREELGEILGVQTRAQKSCDVFLVGSESHHRGVAPEVQEGTYFMAFRYQKIENLL